MLAKFTFMTVPPLSTLMLGAVQEAQPHVDTMRLQRRKV